MYNKLRFIFEDLDTFLNNLKYNKLDFRMILFEYNVIGEKNCWVSYFDSKEKQLVKQNIQKKIFFYNPTQLLHFFKINPETVIINSNNISRDQGLYVVFSFKDKPTVLFADFLNRYQKLILQYVTSHSDLFTPEDLAGLKQDTFNETIKQIIDLDIINALANTPYESRESNGSIIHVKNRGDANYKIKFKQEIDFSLANLRLLRKLLEMCDKRLSLVIYNKHVIGIGHKDTEYQKIQFNGNQKWSINLSQKEKLKYSRGKFFFDRGDLDVAVLPKSFILKKYEKSFLALVGMLRHQKTGALLIISNNARQEVTRLSGFERGYAITPIDLSLPENQVLIKNLSSIDGAVFIDRQLICYGAGIILDGIAKNQGSSARGARYNSARCYLDNKTDATYAALIFSEDETMDIVLNAPGR